MRFVLALTKQHILEKSGGPFGAAVFEQATGKLVSVGVNRVIATGCSAAHAEVMALSLAQQALGTYDLGATGLPATELVVNAQMCAMCMGAVIWSGVRKVSYALSGSEVEVITGFDEGPVPSNVESVLRSRQIQLQAGLLAAESRELLQLYMHLGEPVYNATRGSKE